MRYSFFVVFLFIFTFIISSSNVLAAEFNPNFIISDHDLQNVEGWTTQEVQKFLESKNSYLATFRDKDIDGKEKLASEIIYDAAIRYTISPKFILVTLQKEQSLITTKNPTQKQLDWATGYAVCDGCYLNDPKVLKYKGFAKQIDGAAGVMRWYYSNALTQSFIRKKEAPTYINNELVTPQSWATAFLYTYTPHLHGNKNFWNIWTSWFAQFYPNGTLVRSINTDQYFIIQDGQKRNFNSTVALITRVDPKTAIPMTESDLLNYPNGPAISLPNYSLLKAQSGYYLIDYDYIRPFASEEVVRKLGYNPQEIIEVSENDLLNYKKGESINLNTLYPQGVIWKISDLDNTLYLMKNNILHPFIDPAVAKTNYPNLTIETKKVADLQGFKINDELISFNDGALIKNNGQYFVIEDGLKRRIANEESLKEMGYQQNNASEVSNFIAFIIRNGDPIQVSNQATLNTSNALATNIPPSKENTSSDKTNITIAINDGTVIKDLAKSTLPAYLIAEFTTGKIISGKNIDTKKPIAAIVKILTAYEAFKQNIDLNKSTTYYSKNHSSYGNPFSLIDGEKLLNKDIISSILISSTNNVARMVPTAVNMTEKDFINSINKTLKEIGANNTSIADVTGLSEKNLSTARDILKIFTYSLDYSTIFETMGKTSYTFSEVLNKNNISKHTLKNTNDLINSNNKNFEVLVGRTGYTSEAGSVLVMLIKTKSNNEQYVIITLGNPDYVNKFKEPERLANWVINNAKTVSIASDKK